MRTPIVREGTSRRPRKTILDYERFTPVMDSPEQQFLSGSRVFIGTIDTIKGDQVGDHIKGDILAPSSRVPAAGRNAAKGFGYLEVRHN